MTYRLPIVHPLVADRENSLPAHLSLTAMMHRIPNTYVPCTMPDQFMNSDYMMWLPLVAEHWTQ